MDIESLEANRPCQRISMSLRPEDADRHPPVCAPSPLLRMNRICPSRHAVSPAIREILTKD